MSAVDQLTTRRDRIRASGTKKSSVAFEKLGGTALWAIDQRALDHGIDELKIAIERTAAAHLSVTRSVLKKLVTKELQTPSLDDKVFSAVLGATVRGGQLDSIVCGSETDKPYRVYIHVSQWPRWRRATDAATIELRQKGLLKVRDLETLIFGSRVYNTYSSTLHVLAHLSYLGTVLIARDCAHYAVKDFS